MTFAVAACLHVPLYSTSNLTVWLSVSPIGINWAVIFNMFLLSVYWVLSIGPHRRSSWASSLLPDTFQFSNQNLVPLAEVDDWLERRTAEGALVDVKLYAGLYFAR